MRAVTLLMVLTVLVSAALACGGGSPALTQGTAATQPVEATGTLAESAPTATSSPTVAPSETATPAPTQPANACANPYFPVVKGASWMRTVSVSNRQASTSASSITEVTANGFAVERTNVTNQGTQTWSENWSCTNEGLVQFPSSHALALVGQGLIGDVTAKTLSMTGVTLPPAIDAGSTWSQAYTLEISDDRGVRTYAVTYDFKAIGLEDVTVAAGAFLAMKVTKHMAWSGAETGEFFIIDWIAPDVGLVREEISDIQYVTELESYTIP